MVGAPPAVPPRSADVCCCSGRKPSLSVTQAAANESAACCWARSLSHLGEQSLPQSVTRLTDRHGRQPRPSRTVTPRRPADWPGRGSCGLTRRPSAAFEVPDGQAVMTLGGSCAVGRFWEVTGLVMSRVQWRTGAGMTACRPTFRW